MAQSNVQRPKGILILEDGFELPGELFGAEVSAARILEMQQVKPGTGPIARDRGYGEVVFNTSMTGYQEILTDPSYYGQIVCMTYPHIGNTGVNTEDPESAHPWCAGLIVHEACDAASNWRSSGELDAYLKQHGIPAISGVDTRSLTRHLRTKGVVRGLMLPESERSLSKELLAKLPRFEGRDLIGEVSTREPYKWPPKGVGSAPTARTPPAEGSRYRDEARNAYKVVVMDFGVKWNLLRSLAHFGCEIEVVPASMKAADILAREPDGIFLSNGPGDPAAAPYAAETVKQLVGKVPLFGVCMGHQILALAMGGRTYKLKFGHRGGNQPVLDKETGKVEISSHNHGYAVDGTSVPAGVEVTHMNLNDKTVEGMSIPAKEAFSVQYHPEACPGPHDSVALFSKFVALMAR